MGVRVSTYGKVCPKHPEFNGERYPDHSCVECGRLKCIARRANNPDKVAAYNRQYKAQNRDKVLAKNREFMQRYKHTAVFKLGRKLGKIERERLICAQGIARAYRKEVAVIYAGRPDGFHVDHIVPLNGKAVSGLHVPWNLQYLPAQENLLKSNRVRHELAFQTNHVV